MLVMYSQIFEQVLHLRNKSIHAYICFGKCQMTYFLYK